MVSTLLRKWAKYCTVLDSNGRRSGLTHGQSITMTYTSWIDDMDWHGSSRLHWLSPFIYNHLQVWESFRGASEPILRSPLFSDVAREIQRNQGAPRLPRTAGCGIHQPMSLGSAVWSFGTNKTLKPRRVQSQKFSNSEISRLLGNSY